MVLVFSISTFLLTKITREGNWVRLSYNNSALGMYLTLIIFLLFSPWLNRKIFLQLWKKLWKLLVITIQHLVIMNMIMIKIIWNHQTLQYLIASHHVPGTTGQSGLNICILIYQFSYRHLIFLTNLSSIDFFIITLGSFDSKFSAFL